jgi:hypothetical protein
MQARDAARQQALLDLQSQIDELQRRLPATTPETGEVQDKE